MSQCDKVQLPEEGKKKLKERYKAENFTQESLAQKARTSVDTVKRLLGTKQPEGVERRQADAIVAVLSLTLSDLGVPEDCIAPPPEPVETLVKIVRKRIHGQIKYLCNTMRVLDMSHPICLEQIYTRVNILEKIRSKQRRELSNLLENLPLQDSERFNLGSALETRVPGLNAVERFTKLIILGRPGAGKTTFLKYLAMQCIEEQCVDKHCIEKQFIEQHCADEHCIEKKRLKQLVPFFIPLKEFAEAPGQPDLLAYIESLFQLDTFTIQSVLNEGRGLILLDGLDEVREESKISIKRQIESFINQNYQNKFVITCRLAATEYNFESFTEVEIADFEEEEINYFVKSWFNINNSQKQADKFLKKIGNKDHKPIRELATNPLLLTLLCLVFEDSGSFPTNRSELYKDGLDVLLKKWDAKRYIEREQIYKSLSQKHKENLLSQIAYSTFITGNYVFKQERAEREISNYMEKLPPNDQNDSEVDGGLVLKLIEAQHGLLMERARRIYSFSHLTFHEYFTARHIVANCDPNSIDSPMLQELMERLTNRTWREVFLLTSEMLVRSDSLLRLMKAKIDGLLAEDKELQKFLQWVDEQSRFLSALVGDVYSLAAIRACYLDFDIALDVERTLGWVLNPDFTRAFTCASFLARADRCEVKDIFTYRSNELPNLSRLSALDPALAVTFARAEVIRKLLVRVEDSQLGQELQKLNEDLPSEFKNNENINEDILIDWWKNIGKNWGDRLRKVIVPYYSLGGNWRYEKLCNEQQNPQIEVFSNKQKDLLNQYYYANLLLVVCLKSDCCVAPSVRQEIEETLLLPVSLI
ncbi:signal transduction protein [Crinalium epipsammum PCC 9333]|uniref:Signal transduction protein n=1 Tax=Crinalium epipsammum PCC 9333 TaxID=1173022 RepID=K9VTM9_9CYAN|nr:NACHT domain-containing protein [Crinalium epipsammum]AFZ11438.1 signal transduction protein [Crinalium epipsammum PCC 9333]